MEIEKKTLEHTLAEGLFSAKFRQHTARFTLLPVTAHVASVAAGCVGLNIMYGAMACDPDSYQRHQQHDDRPLVSTSTEVSATAHGQPLAMPYIASRTRRSS